MSGKKENVKGKQGDRSKGGSWNFKNVTSAKAPS